MYEMSGAGWPGFSSSMFGELCVCAGNWQVQFARVCLSADHLTVSSLSMCVCVCFRFGLVATSTDELLRAALGVVCAVFHRFTGLSL
jgi:hypothetical protein